MYKIQCGIVAYSPINVTEDMCSVECKRCIAATLALSNQSDGECHGVTNCSANISLLNWLQQPQLVIVQAHYGSNHHYVMLYVVS